MTPQKVDAGLSTVICELFRLTCLVISCPQYENSGDVKKNIQTRGQQKDILFMLVEEIHYFKTYRGKINDGTVLFF